MTTSVLPRHNSLSAALLSALVVFGAGLVGSLATISNLVPWYETLHKPVFTPPNWIFGPVWTTLYVLMALAFWRVLTCGADTSLVRPAVFRFLIQMALNAFWSVAFFGLHSPPGGLVVILLLTVAILVTVAAFCRIDRLAAALLLPYLAWVSFATALNAAVWWLNR